jgi:hypothetical protein
MMTTSEVVTSEEDEQAERIADARARRARTWTPKEKVQLIKQSVAMLRELLEEARWRWTFFDNMSDDTYPQCGEACCAEGGGVCTLSDRLSERDKVTNIACALVQAWESVIEATERSPFYPGPDDPIWAELEKRFAKAAGRAAAAAAREAAEERSEQ